jgi:ABC-2 type transport system permease protein
MRALLAIARKELGIYFTTMIAYSGFGAFSFVLGLVFFTNLNKFQKATNDYLAQQRPELLALLNFNDQIIGPLFSTCAWLFLFFVPFLTMRLFAEEKSNRTFELLMTAPITSLEMVLGKFLAVALMIALMTSMALIYPVILAAYGTGTTTAGGVEWAPVWSGLLAIFMLGVTFSAVGLFVSALTESQIVAALLTFALLLMTFVVPMIAQTLEGDWRAVLEYLTPVTHVGRGLEGRVHLKDLVYFGSVLAISLFSTLRAVESHRWR